MRINLLKLVEKIISEIEISSMKQETKTLPILITKN